MANSITQFIFSGHSIWANIFYPLRNVLRFAIISGMDIVLTFCEEDGRRSFPMIMDGVCRFARTRKWHVENITFRDRQMRIDRLLGFWKPIGCIVESSPEETLPRKAFGRIPVVFFNHEAPATGASASIVGMDHPADVELAISELSKGDPVHFGFVPYLNPSRPWCRLRENAFRKHFDPARSGFSVFHPACRSKRLPRINFIRQLRPWLRSIPKPCGILAANDETASVVVTACSMEGIAVPTDVAVIGIDDDPVFCCNSDPEISSVRPNFTQGAYMAAKLLDRAIRHPSWPGKHVVYPPLGVSRRDSTRSHVRADLTVDSALDLIRAKACSGLTAATVCKTFPCTRRKADERFRAFTGKSILEAIQEERLQHMKDLLSKPAQALDSIANLCGYSSRNAACKFFRIKTGLTMSAWRKKHRN